jgi:uncharacterized protein YcaQ
MIRLSRAEARQVAVRAQLLDAGDDAPADLVEVVRRLTFLQVDPTSAIAPAVDHVVWSRLGDAVWPGAVDDAIADRLLYQLVGTVRATADLPLFLAEMAAWPSGETGHGQQWLAANEGFRRDVLALLRDEGPVLSREVPDTAAVPWRSSGWTGDRNVTLMLELLSERGLAAIAGREGRERLWDLAERVYPPAEPLPLAEARAERGRRRMRALGISRPRILAGASGEHWRMDPPGEPAVVDGVDGQWRVDPAVLAAVRDRGFTGRTALLSPFDRLVHDRARLLDLFDLDYVVEMFKPAAQRRFGSFALPVLHGDRFVGRLDAKADRKAGLLRVHAVHEELPFDDEVGAAVDEQIRAMARWLRLDVVR